MENVSDSNNQKKIINILPLGKGKRIFSFLADFFINFILAFLLFIIASLPLGKLFTGYGNKNSQYSSNLNHRGEVLIGNKILFDSHDVDIYDIEYNVDFTSDCFLSYYAIDEENPTNTRYSQFGHKGENQIFHTYFLSIVNNEEKFISLFDNYNHKYQYFNREGTTIFLKEDIKEQIVPHFYKNESVSKVGNKYLKNLKNSFYYPMYSEIMDSIRKNDLTFGSYSYNSLQSQIKNFEKYVYDLIQYSSLITVFVSTFFLYLIIPIINKGHKTIAMFIMKIERVHITSLRHLKKREIILTFIYQLFMAFLISFFIPITSLSFAEMFKIQLLFIIGIFSIFMMLINLVYLLFDKFNRSLFDRLLSLVHLPTAELDDVYRAKGYYL